MKIPLAPPLLIASTASVLHTQGQCDCDCDCACPAPASLELNPHEDFMPDGPLRRVQPVYTLSLDQEDLLLLYGPKQPPVVINRTANQLLAAFQQPMVISELPNDWHLYWGEEQLQVAVRALRTAGLLITDHEAGVRLCKTSQILTAWLHLTGRCNLRCVYCYAPSFPDLPLKTGMAAVEGVIRSAVLHGYHRVKLKYAGGEPLLRLDLLERLHQHARTLAEEHQIELDGVVLSNGICLNQAAVETLQTQKLRLMISLDGIGKHHDRQRPYFDGGGSCGDVIKSIDLALDLGLTPDLSITISSISAAGLPETVAWILDRGLPFSFNLYREHPASISQPGLKFTAGDILPGILAAFKTISANLPEVSLLSALADRGSLAVPHARTCGVGQDYLVIDPYGRVVKCQMQFDQVVGTVWERDPLAAVQQDILGIQNLTVDEKQSCRQCMWRYWCCGGCPIETYRATGRYDVKSPHCSLYRKIFPEILRLEGLRLLKYGNKGPIQQSSFLAC